MNLSEHYPLFDSYQVSQEYINLLNTGFKPYFLNLIEEKRSILLFRRNITEELFDLITPIHFQVRLSKVFWDISLAEVMDVLAGAGCISFYMQTKNSIDANIIENDLVNVSRYRTNYYVDLMDMEQDFIQRQAKDSRQRLRKVLKEYYQIQTNSLILSDFSKFYSKIALRKEFDMNYRYNIKQFQYLISNKNVDYIEITDRQNNFLCGGIFAKSGKDVDYLYGADSNIRKDAIRLLIFEASKYYKTQNYQRLYLGGGTYENDSLAEFKRRLGAKEAICTTIRGVANRKIAEELYGARFDQSWFDGFFPPYASNTSAIK